MASGDEVRNKQKNKVRLPKQSGMGKNKNMSLKDFD